MEVGLALRATKLSSHTVIKFLSEIFSPVIPILPLFQLGVVGKLKVNNGRSEQNKAQKTRSQFIVASSDAAVILDSLKKTLDNVASLIEFGIKGIFNLEIDFIRNENCRSVFKSEFYRKSKHDLQEIVLP